MTTLVVDGSNLERRSLGAARLTRSDGQEVGAAIAFAVTLAEIVRRYAPTHGAVVFDGPGRSFRRTAYSTYKDNRERVAQQGEAWQCAAMRATVRATGLSVVPSAPYEADDIITSLTHACRGPVVVASDDKDTHTLLALPRVRVHLFRTRGLMTAADAERHWGVPPHLIPDVQALCGDAGDRVPGLPGVGRVTAARAVLQYGSWERALCHAPEWAGRRWVEISSACAAARAGSDLVRMHSDAPCAPPPALRGTWATGIAQALCALESRRDLARLCRIHGIAESRITPLDVIAADTQQSGADPLPADLFD